jgi:hypothetical protein
MTILGSLHLKATVTVGKFSLNAVFTPKLTENCWKLRHTQYSSHWNDGFGATDRVSCIDDLSKFYSSGDPPFRGGFA